MQKKIEIHETAFVISTYRSMFDQVSCDQFAHLWNNPKTDIWIEEYLREVSDAEALLHALRNRYFYETVKSLWEKGAIEVMINFGCGFSMYPFLFHENMEHIEIDKPDIIAYKKAKIGKWQKEKQLPTRTINFISSDFNEDYETALLEKIMPLVNGKSTFILLEGVLFFLNRESTVRLFNLFDAIQGVGDRVGAVSYRTSIENTAVFKRLIRFFEQKVAADKSFHYQTIDDDFYENINHYKLIGHEDYCSLSAQYTPDQKMDDPDAILNEHMYLLQKK